MGKGRAAINLAGRNVPLVQVGAVGRDLLHGVSLSARKASLVFLLILFLIAVMLQIADGWLTYQGVSLYGNGAEGNPLIRMFMNFMGPVASLLLFKGAGIVILSYLYFRTPNIHTKYWLFGTVIVLYLSFAILPWLYFLYKK